MTLFQFFCVFFDAQHDLRRAPSINFVRPDIDELAESVQHQGSH